MKQAGFFLVLVACSVELASTITTSRQVGEAMRAASSKEEAAEIVVDGYNKFYFQSAGDRTAITSALKKFYSTHGVSPLPVVQEQRLEQLQHRYNENEGAYAGLAKEFLSLRETMTQETEKFAQEATTLKKEYAAFEEEYTLLISPKLEDKKKLAQQKRSENEKLRTRRDELAAQLEACQKG